MDEGKVLWRLPVLANVAVAFSLQLGNVRVTGSEQPTRCCDGVGLCVCVCVCVCVWEHLQRGE
jgi:hypothetical protein